MTERYIERDFPIVQLNPLSVRERNAFYPVYKMHNWYARRSASIFRALLLACALPYEDENGEPIDLMKEFFSNHEGDVRLLGKDGKPLKVLDPFMGGGTTIVEGARLGLDMTGIDYNPIAWFIVKGETTPVDLDELDAAYERVADKVKDDLLDLYKTPCPITGEDADIIYGFWVKQGHCIDPQCGAVTDLFKNYEVARKRGKATIKYLADVECPGCKAVFDWELNRCTITAGGEQIEGDLPQGSKRDGIPYAFGRQDDGVDCPCCGQLVREKDLSSQPDKKSKKIPLHVLVDPTTGEFFEVRGGIPKEVTAPSSGHTFEPKNGTTSRGKFVCSSCGRKQSIVDSADAYGKPLPFRYYGFYAHTPHVSNGDEKVEAELAGLDTNNDKWFAPVVEVDRKKYEDASNQLDKVRDELPIPNQRIYDGYNTNRLVIHKYEKWSDLFSDRHLLALGMLLKAIGEEEIPALRDALLGAFQSHIDNVSNLASYDIGRNMLQRVTAAHDYRNPTTCAENNIWGMGQGRGPFSNCYSKFRDGIDFAKNSYLKDVVGDKKFGYDLGLSKWKTFVSNGSCSGSSLREKSLNLIITDPPYAGSVQYAEMSDWFYVWLHQVLKDHYPEFEPEITLKSQEIIEDEQNKGPREYFEMLTEAWRECHRVLKDDGILAFTFHHKEGDRWTGLLKSLFEAGFYLVAAYPTHSEALNSIVIQSTGGITYDIVHVCKKLLSEPEDISWTKLRKQVREEARAQLKQIEGQTDVLPEPDVWMILLGKALKLFSQHYGKVLDSDGSVLDLEEGLKRLSVLVRGVRGEELPLSANLQDADGLSQVYFLHVVGKPRRSSDDLHKSLQGYAHSPDDLKDAGLVAPSEEDKTKLEVIPPLTRFAEQKLDTSKRGSLVDKLHTLLGTLEAGEDIKSLMEGWVGQWGTIKDGLKHIGDADASSRELCEMARRAIDALGDESSLIDDGQQSLKL